MKRTTKLCALLLLVLLAACSIEVSDTTPTAPSSEVASGPIPAFTLSAPLARKQSSPPPWANLKLSGSLIYVQIPRQIVKLDLASGQRTTSFEAPGNGFVSAAQVSRDGKWIVMAYAPPKDPALQSINTDLYLLPADGSSAPQILLQRADPKEDFFNPVWSADDQSVYYSHLIPDPTSARKYTNFTYELERVAVSSRQPEKILDKAYWPSLSPDGTKLAYVSFEPASNSNDLYVANPDSSQPKLVMPTGAFFAVDAPLISHDGQTILFSAVGDPQRPGLSWLDQLMGVQIAEAHSVPSDWWRASINGGKPERLTRINGTGLYADFSPDGQHIAFVSIPGL